MSKIVIIHINIPMCFWHTTVLLRVCLQS